MIHGCGSLIGPEWMNRRHVLRMQRVATETGNTGSSGETVRRGGINGRGGGRFVLVNLVGHFVYFGANALISFWYTPFVIRHLGVAPYGVVALASSVAQYVSVLTSGVSASVGRFLTIELVRGDQRTASRTFNSSMALALGMVIVMLPIVGAISYAAPTWFDAPPGTEAATRYLFLAATLSILAGGVGSVFAASAFAHNRLYLQNAVSSLRLLVRTSVVVALFAAFRPHLWHVAVGLVFAEAVAVGVQWRIWRWLTPTLRLRPWEFDRTRLRHLGDMTWWVVVNQIGSVLFLNIDLLVVNALYGSRVTGRYAAVLQFPTLLRALATVISSTVYPVVFARYARHDMEGVAATSRCAVRLMGLAMALPVGFLCGMSRKLLELWLGPSFGDLYPLMLVLVGHLAINLSIVPLFSVTQAYNRVRAVGIVTLFTGAANVLLAAFLAGYCSLGPLGVAVAGGIVLTAKNTLFTALYAARIQRLPAAVYLHDVAIACVGTAAVAMLSWLGSVVVSDQSWLRMLITLALVSAAYAPLAYAFLLGRQDRAVVTRLVHEGLMWRQAP